MSSDLKTIYRAANLPEAKLVADELEDRGIRAVIIDENAGATFAFAHTTNPRVQVEAEDEEKAKLAIEQFKELLDARGIRYKDDPPDVDEHWKDWPTCRGCGRRRLARCPACEETSTDFPLADYHERGEEARALDDEGRVKTAAVEEEALPFLLCPHCDETFLATFYRKCAWCGHDSGSGIAAVESREPLRTADGTFLYVMIAFFAAISFIILAWAWSLRN